MATRRPPVSPAFGLGPLAPALLPAAATAAAGLGTHGLGPAVDRFLVDLRVTLSLADAPTGSPAGPTRGGGSHRDEEAAERAGFAPGEAPDDFARVAALVDLAQEGDAEAFGMVYDRYVDTVYRYILVRVGSHHLAEDLTSETFLRALRRLDSFSWQGRDIAAWFITIARNLITDNAKSARFRMEVTTADMLDADRRVPAVDGEVISRLRDERLLEAVKALKPEQAECVVLRFLQGLSLAETAAVLGKSEGAVKQLQLRAVRSLHRALGEEDL